ncbi:MAG: hypothetical protein AABX28_03055 [Nanoarchaeota archaeon]
MSDDKQKYHNKGQEDAAAGKPSNPPHGTLEVLTDFFAPSSSFIKKDDEDNAAYKAGYTNTEKQKK